MFSRFCLVVNLDQRPTTTYAISWRKKKLIYMSSLLFGRHVISFNLKFCSSSFASYLEKSCMFFKFNNFLRNVGQCFLSNANYQDELFLVKCGTMFLVKFSHLWCTEFVKQLLEMVCEKYGGRVDMAKAYYKALTASVRKHFKGNGVIASMEHCNDFMLLGTEAISFGRVGT